MPAPSAPSKANRLSQCSLLSNVLEPYIGTLCPATLQTPCSEECVAVVSSYVHVCSEYVANDPELMSSLTSRTRMCEDGMAMTGH